MLRIAVCDDEQEFIRQMSAKIKKHMPDCEIHPFVSGTSLLSDERMFDVYFLDIQMKNLNGIETAKKLREQNEDCIVVFVTGAKEYVFDAFDVAALHYLLKPVSDEKLCEVLERAENEIGKRQGGRKLLVKTRDRKVLLDLSEVMYFEANVRKVMVHTRKGALSFYGVLADVEKKAGDGFFRCHRGYLVNLSYVREYDTESIKLTNGETLYLSKARYHDFVKCYMRFLRNGGVADA